MPHREPDWTELWKQLVEMSAWKWQGEGERKSRDKWQERARDFDRSVKERWQNPDSSRSFILSQLSHDCTLLDIGAGTGAWCILTAQRIRRVTALEPSPSMRSLLLENLRQAGISNVEVLPEAWPEAQVEPHDITLCAHAMYGIADFALFVRRMEQVTRRLCIMILRTPLAGSVMTDAARHVLGHPHDSPNFTIAFNALLQMGIYPNVIMEEDDAWAPWQSATLEEALQKVKSRLALGDEARHDAFLKDLLERRLQPCDEGLRWPPGIRSALIYWQPGELPL
jgi:SAM-dependent methyltransferase